MMPRLIALGWTVWIFFMFFAMVFICYTWPILIPILALLFTFGCIYCWIHESIIQHMQPPRECNDSL